MKKEPIEIVNQTLWAATWIKNAMAGLSLDLAVFQATVPEVTTLDAARLLMRVLLGERNEA